jgi:hypothetical protein
LGIEFSFQKRHSTQAVCDLAHQTDVQQYIIGRIEAPIEYVRDPEVGQLRA